MPQEAPPPGSIIAASLAGGPLAFVKRMGTRAATGRYPLGLGVGLLWAYTGDAVHALTNAKSNSEY
jgi:hypothetical protein